MKPHLLSIKIFKLKKSKKHKDHFKLMIFKKNKTLKPFAKFIRQIYGKN